MQRLNLTFGPSAASTLVIQGGGRLIVANGLETTGAAAATFKVLDGNASDAKLLVPIYLPAGTSSSDYFGDHGIPFTNGIYVEAVTGTFEGNVLIHLDEDYEAWQLPVIVANTVTIDNAFMP